MFRNQYPDREGLLTLVALLLWDRGGQVEFSDELLSKFEPGRIQIETSEDFMRNTTKVRLIGMPFPPPRQDEHDGPIRANAERLDRPREIGGAW